LWIGAQRLFISETKEAILKYRAQLEKYIEFYPIFKDTLSPLSFDPLAPKIVQQMLIAAKKTGVGPMAAVAGALAQAVGHELLSYSDEVIVENGGDIFLKINSCVQVAIFCGRSPLSGKIGLRISPPPEPIAICASSATIGHSLSFGRADVVAVVARDAAIADAAATAIGNVVKSKDDILIGVKLAQEIKDIIGLVVVLDEHLAMWGQVDLIKL
jgi:hypothetical protein